MRQRSFGTAAIFAASMGFAAGAQAIELPSYEASYELQLIYASAGKGPRAAVGTFDSYFAETCDGWDTKSRVVIDLTFPDSSTSTNERFFTSWEAKNGMDYRFTAQTIKNGETVEAFKGTARITRNGGQATYEPLDAASGKKIFITLPAHTLLPVAQSRTLIERAGLGENLVRNVVLNGASSAGPRAISTIISPQTAAHNDPAASSNAEIDAGLLAKPAWRMSSAFFNLNENRDVPNTEVYQDVHQSGVTESFEQTFDDFTLSARLTKLRRLEKPTCGS